MEKLLESHSTSSTGSDCGVCLEPVPDDCFIEMPCCKKRACIKCATEWEEERARRAEEGQPTKSAPYACLYCRAEYQEPIVSVPPPTSSLMQPLVQHHENDADEKDCCDYVCPVLRLCCFAAFIIFNVIRIVTES